MTHAGANLLPGFLFGAILALSGIPAHATPYIPANDSEVVETLPESIVSLSRELRAAEAMSAEPVTGQALMDQSLSAYQIAVTQQEPRAYGRVISLLESWPQDEEKPALHHILMAAVLQHNHEFEQALEELDLAVEKEPDNPQSYLIRAQIGLVTGDYELTAASCSEAEPLVSATALLNCQAQLDGVTGNAEAAFDAVNTVLSESSPGRQDRLELHITAAAIAQRLGRTAAAGNHYVAALRLHPLNRYVLVNYSDLLLQNDRPEVVVTLLDLLPPETLNEELKVLLAQALQGTGSDQGISRAQELTAELQAGFESAELRGEGIPYKDMARFHLAVVNDPQKALAAARANWQLQKEPSDTLLLARAARAADDEETLDSVAQWMDDNGTEDVRIRQVLTAAGGQP